MTECTQSRLPFAHHGRREVVAEFSGGTMTSDSGALLLRETDRRMKLLARFRQCFLDGRNQALVQHPVEQMLAQRIYSLALGYEDLNDHVSRPGISLDSSLGIFVEKMF
ncbi:MAG: transposase [Bryobacteraceae bacterium]